MEVLKPAFQRWSMVVPLLLVACSAGQATTTSQPGKEPSLETTLTSDSDDITCGGQDRPGGVRVWHSMSGNSSLDVLDTFRGEIIAEMGIEVEYERFEGDADVLKALTSRDRARWPDIVIVTEQATRSLLDSGHFLAPGVCTPVLTEDILAPVAATYTVQGELTALPLGVSVPVLVFDAARYEQAGLDPSDPPETLTELLEASATIRDSGVSPHGLVMADSCANYLIEQMAARSGEILGQPDNGHGVRGVQVDLASDHAIDDLTAVRDAVWDGHVKYIGPNPSGFDDLVTLTMPVDGAVLAVHTSGALGDVVALLGAGNFAGVTLGVAPLPGPGNGSLIGGNALWLRDSGESGQLHRAVRVLEWFYQSEHLARFAAATGYVPPTKASASHQVLQDHWTLYPQLKVAYEQVLETEVSGAMAGLLIGPFDDKASVLFQLCNKVLKDGDDVAAAVSSATDSINSLIAQYEAGFGGPAPSTTTTSPAKPTELKGNVRCESGSAVVGVWVTASGGGSGWAQLSDSGDGATVFSRTVDRPGEYQVHVGCGGTPDYWASTYHSYFVTANDITFLCMDAERRAQGRCEQQPISP